MKNNVLRLSHGLKKIHQRKISQTPTRSKKRFLQHLTFEGL